MPLAHIYVGSGKCGERPSPWGNPFIYIDNLSIPAAAREFVRYAKTRADLDSWLFPLTDYTLRCDCGRSYCHAAHLADLVYECFADNPQDHLCFHDLCPEQLEDAPEGPEEDPLLCFQDCDNECNPQGCDFGNFDLSVFDETTRGAMAQQQDPIPANPAWPESWHALVATIRAAEVQLFWELFAGCAILTTSFEQRGWMCAPPIDILINADFNLLNVVFLAVIVGILLEGRIALLHVGPPCSSFSMAVNRFLRWRMRSVQFPGGLPNLLPHQQEKVRVGNALADVAVVVCKAQQRAGGAWQWEQPATSLQLLYDPVAVFFAQFAVAWAYACVCAWGAPWRKETVVIANRHNVEGVHKGCPSTPHTHIKLEGQAPDGRSWTAVAGPYWPAFARDWAACWDESKGQPVQMGKTAHISGFLGADVSKPLSAEIAARGFVPSRKRDATVIAQRTATGVQPTGRALPSLLPEGLDPDTHLLLALQTPHPFRFPPPLSGPCQYAITHQVDDPGLLAKQRSKMQSALVQLEQAVCDESRLLLQHVHRWLVKIVEKRNIPFCRELSFIACFPDLMLWPDYLLGMPMAGWARRAPTMVPREKTPLCSVQDLLCNVDSHNWSIWERIGPTGDPALDAASWKKTKKEFQDGALIGPFDHPWQLPDLSYRLLPRFPIWEQHGGASEPSCRNIDDCLQGGQNDSVGLQYTNRPADQDAWAALNRGMQERFPEQNLAGLTSDFKGAYKQDTADPHQATLFAVTTWDDERKMKVIGLAVAQLFGGSSAPLNFTRIPDWCCHMMAFFFTMAMVHCVDDMLSTERLSTIHSGFCAWRMLADLCGWDVPDEKSPPPSVHVRALGAMTDYTSLPTTIKVTEERELGLFNMLHTMKTTRRLLSGVAGQFFGKAGFANSQRYGKYGRAKLRPFSRRQRECGRSGLNIQLEAAIDWWMKSLFNAPPREIPLNLSSMDTVVTYSDGEGSDAGVGVAIWSTRLPQMRPQAGFTFVPDPIRRLWAYQKDSDVDILEVEAIGPLILLENWKDVLQHCLWVHYIDNNGALAALINGSSSVLQADLIVGETWARVARQKVLPWFDRVDTKANPVDGISRQKFDGPWLFRPVRFPEEILKDIIKFLEK